MHKAFFSSDSNGSHARCSRRLLPAAVHAVFATADADAETDVDVEADADIDAVTCTNIPPATALANFAFDDCKDMAAGEDCDAECAAGHDGLIKATCRADGTFDIAGSCQPSEEDDRQGGEVQCCSCTE